jgi:hypothetical protein
MLRTQSNGRPESVRFVTRVGKTVEVRQSFSSAACLPLFRSQVKALEHEAAPPDVHREKLTYL